MDRLNQWLTLVANIGVVAGVLFVGFEIKQNTEQVQAQVAQGIMAALREQGNALAQSTDVSEVYYRGLSGLNNLSDTERFQVNAINAGYFRVFEEAFLHHKVGRLEDEYWNALSGQLKKVLAIPGTRENWEQVGDNYNQDFIDFANSLINQT